MTEPTNHELSERVAVLEERMNTSYERLRASMADLKTDMARRDVEVGKRENRLLLAILGGIAVATMVLGVLITAQ